jgi:long-chain acyl-CoA synthetase
MTEPTRLFDCLAYHLERNTIPDMLAAKEGGQWKTYSTEEVSTLANQLSAGLLNLGIGGGDMTEEGRDKVAILSKNRPEWMILDLAVQQIGAVLTPVYPTITPHDLAFILQDSQVKIVFVNDGDLLDKVRSIQGQAPSVREIFTFESVPGARQWKEILRSVDENMASCIAQASARIKPEHLATIIYTSGTTGVPKGVMLSHNNILGNVQSSIRCFPPGQLRALSFLPLNHILERMVTYLYFFRGTSVYYAENMDTIGQNLTEIRPHIFVTVPRLLEKVYDRIMQKGDSLKGISKKLFFWAHDLASRFEINQELGFWYRIKLAIANKLIFSKWRQALGNRLVCIVIGGAACQVRLIRIFTAARIPIMEGYGLTETSPVVSVNRFEEKDRKFGTVGPILDGVEVRIAEDGEILTKGPNLMMGYYKHPEMTAEAIVDGWFHTGDIGVLEGGFLKITDRKKELFKTSGGKYVAPLPIESKLKESPYIEQALVVGPERKFVGALIVPSFSNLKNWCLKNGISYSSDEEMIRNPRVLELYRREIDQYNMEFSHVEQVKRFQLLPREWSVETGEMTPKLSLKRKIITEKYQDAIDRIYA